MSSLYVLGAVRARIRKGPIHRGDWTRRAGREGRTVELHVSPVGVELRLALVLPLLHALNPIFKLNSPGRWAGH